MIEKQQCCIKLQFWRLKSVISFLGAKMKFLLDYFYYYFSYCTFIYLLSPATPFLLQQKGTGQSTTLIIITVDPDICSVLFLSSHGPRIKSCLLQFGILYV